MAAKVEPLMTIDDLEAMPEDGNRYEIIEGELFVSRSPGLPHQIVSGNLHYQLMLYLDRNPIGRIVATPGLVFDRFSGVVPDLVCYSHQRGAEIIANDRLNAAPEIVIEILSPGRQNISRDRVSKRQLYAKFGVKEYWIVDSRNQAIEMYCLEDQKLELVRTARAEDELTSPVLPGFDCAVTKIFET